MKNSDQISGFNFRPETGTRELTYAEKVRRALGQIADKEKSKEQVQEEWQKFIEDIISISTTQILEKHKIYNPGENRIRTRAKEIAEILMDIDIKGKYFQGTVKKEIENKLGANSPLRLPAKIIPEITNLAMAAFQTKMPTEIPTTEIKAEILRILDQL